MLYTMSKKISIDLIYALPEKQWQQHLNLAAGDTVAAAITASQLFQHFPELEQQDLLIGIWGKRTNLQYVLQNHDRVEIYRPLIIDPKQARQIKVLRERKKQAKQR